MVTSLPLVLLVLALTAPPVVRGTITCKAFTSATQSSVTCFFGVDVAETKHNFNLQFYYPDLHADPDTLLMCNWVTKGQIECKKSQDITYDNVISDQLIMKGPSMVHKMTGKYVCQLVPSINVPATPCNITFREDPPQTVRPHTMNPAILEEIEEINERSKTSLRVSTATLVIVIIAIVIALLLFFCRTWIEELRKSLCNKKKGNTNPEEGETGIEESHPLTALEQTKDLQDASTNERMAQNDVVKENEKEQSQILEKAAEKARASLEAAEEEASRRIHEAETKSEKEKENAVKAAKDIRKKAKSQVLKDAKRQCEQIKKDAVNRAKKIKKDGKTKVEKKDAEGIAKGIVDEAEALAHKLEQQVQGIVNEQVKEVVLSTMAAPQGDNAKDSLLGGASTSADHGPTRST